MTTTTAPSATATSSNPLFWTFGASSAIWESLLALGAEQAALPGTHFHCLPVLSPLGVRTARAVRPHLAAFGKKGSRDMTHDLLPVP